MIVDLGEELEDPSRAIPKVLLYGAVISLSLFTVLVAVLVGVMNWSQLGTGDGAVVTAARTFLPRPLVGLVAVGAVGGSLTSISTTYTGYSRALMRAARDNLFPKALAKVHSQFETPHVALLMLGVPPLLLAPFEPTPVFLSIFLSLAVLIGMSIKAIALWRLPSAFPERYANADVTLSPRVLRAVAIGGATSAGVLMAVTLLQRPWIIGVIAAYIAVGYGYYRVRIRQLHGRNVDLRAVMRSLAEYE